MMAAVGYHQFLAAVRMNGFVLSPGLLSHAGVGVEEAEHLG